MFKDSPDPFPTRNPCAFEGCNVSVEEHHRLSRGYSAEVTALKAKMRQPETINLEDISSDILLAEITKRLKG